MLSEGTRKSNEAIIKRKTVRGDLLKLQLESKSVAIPRESVDPLLSGEQADEAQDRFKSEMRVKEHGKRLQEMGILLDEEDQENSS